MTAWAQLRIGLTIAWSSDWSAVRPWVDRPMRLGQMLVLRPFTLFYIVLPIAKMFMAKKLADRIINIGSSPNSVRS